MIILSRFVLRVARYSLASVSLLVTFAAGGEGTVPPQRASGPGLTGTLISVGSDTMVYLVSFWAVEFKRLHPDVRVVVEQAGSATAPPALLSGEATIGPMSRRMKDKEIAAFEKKFGYPPTEIRVALDTLPST